MIDYDLSWLEQKNNCVITFNDANYPAQLKEIADPPPVLFVRGNPESVVVTPNCHRWQSQPISL